jgi:hypothetical protein
MTDGRVDRNGEELSLTMVDGRHRQSGIDEFKSVFNRQ